jgi:hypothetical protein
LRFGPRRPSFRKRLAARTSLRRYIRHSLGVKAPRGLGWLTNPKRAAYNRVYNRTSFKGCSFVLAALLGVVTTLAIAVLAESAT